MLVRVPEGSAGRRMSEHHVERHVERDEALTQREAAPKLYCRTTSRQGSVTSLPERASNRFRRTFLSPLRCGPLCNRYLTFHAMKSEIASIQKKIAKDLTITFRLVCISRGILSATISYKIEGSKTYSE